MLHALSIPVILIVEFLVGIGTVLFDVGSMAYLPRLVDRDQIARGNSQLQSVSSIAMISGPALGGLFVSLFMAPRAVIAAVVLWVVSVAAIWRIRTPEPAPEPDAGGVKPVRQIAEDIRFVAGNPICGPSRSSPRPSTSALPRSWSSSSSIYPRSSGSPASRSAWCWPPSAPAC